MFSLEWRLQTTGSATGDRIARCACGTVPQRSMAETLNVQSHCAGPFVHTAPEWGLGKTGTMEARVRPSRKCAVLRTPVALGPSQPVDELPETECA
eukprot:5467376-Alexandrium_andersonii.AAC.1